MKKYVFCCLLLIAAAGFTGCGTVSGEQIKITETQTEAAVAEISSAEDVTENVTVTDIEESVSRLDCKAILDDIISAVEFPSMAEIGYDRAGIYLDCVIPEDCDFAMYICGSGGFADELCIVDADKIDGDSFEAAVEKRIESRKKDFEGYNPDEFEKLQNSMLKLENGYYLYAVSVDNDKCEEIFDNYVKN